MQIREIYTARFFRPGSFVGETWETPVDSLSPDDVEWPKEAYAFQLRKSSCVIVDGVQYKSDTTNVGPMYYHPDSKVMTLAEIEARNDPNDRILLSNMRMNNWPAVVLTRWGNWPQPTGNDIKILKRRTS